MMSTSASLASKKNICCPECGQSDYFIQVMSVVENLVHGNSVVVRQIWGRVDHYKCRDCGAWAAEGDNDDDDCF